MRGFPLSLGASLLAWALLLVLPPTPAPSGHSPESRASAAANLAHVRILEFRPRVLGYEREQFGAGWAVRSWRGRTASTRQLMLDEVFGTTNSAPDPYTTAMMTRSNVDVDHVVPLAAAWDLGAWAWDPATRRRFANDIERNLLLTASQVNREKSDSTLAEWLPPDAGVQCEYVARFLEVVTGYSLSISQRDAVAARGACDL